MRLVIGDRRLTLEDLINVTRKGYKVEISEGAYKKVAEARELVDRYVKEKKVSYGITTGFGKFSDTVISEEQTGLLQKNLIMSHSCGVGNPIPVDMAKGIMLLRIVNLSKGHSGVRKIVLDTLVDMLNKDVTPFIPEKGSLGASGDLAPLSHMVLVMLGMGKAYVNGELLDGAEAMKKAGVPVLEELSSKEGLALINGTQVMTSIGAHVTYDAINLMKHLDIAGALTMEALNGITCAFDHRVHEVRGHQGQIRTAENFRNILKESKCTTKQGEMRTQDPYTLRCIPQIHGASKDALEFVREKVEIEMDAVTDNPIIFCDTDDVISGGNFHGQPMALPFDFLGIAVSEMANVSERRIERLVNPHLNCGLPAFLVENGGVNSGFMIVQYSAASLVSENKVLAHPASVDSIPSSANQEDHVSMGTIAARKAGEILKNARKVIAMEILSACQGIDLKKVNKDLGLGTEKAYTAVRETVSYYDKDRVMNLDINAVEELIERNKIVENVEKVIGELKI
ncbi:histidine ammonia-lyase [Fusobacterium ulcerans]|jgi:histidine ammonia-lyase|uniref:Histidine ammonia-lyase n=1 Tax=Fusobacterium ulcerans TaxID=861 RepID=A0AAX1TMI2_9FUSO|nr:MULTISPECIES: histidine ammonia-lyase [Fusobacterium]AVQ28336.1 histidine ammonia-lyase [Fusobacterium ulcerans]EFS25806.1 histidine ammonia-lyase [Fusobacterium ulcerans ATCC 49185]MDH6459793.1 histidine ammonia-lyase [Fusobacterium sp. PH5-7]RGY59001.1 histidine ammonia-lyase [Fusobacterium ulcerans]SQJ00135.1 Histidine ammonia-lyase [Fusobacterium ulcerans]